MNDSLNNAMSNSTPPKWFWWVSGLALIWNLMGVGAFFLQMFADPSSLSEAERVFYENTPAWATAGFALAVFGGTIGCLALLLRKQWAFVMLAICVLGIVVQNSHSIFVGNGIEVFGNAGLAMPIMTFAIGVLLVWFAHFSAKKGWLS